MRKSLMVSNIIYLSWKNNFKKFTDNNPLLKIGFPLIALCLFILLIILSESAIYPFIKSYGLDGIRMVPVILAASFINLSLFTGMLLTMFLLISPERNSLELSMHWMPISVFQKKIGYYIPLSVIVLLFLCILYIPILLAISKGISLSYVQIFLLFLSTILQILFVEFIFLSLVEIYRFIFGYLLSLPQSRLLSVGSALGTLIIYFGTNFQFDMLQNLYEKMEYNLLYIMLINVFSTISSLFTGNYKLIVLVNILFFVSILVLLGTVFLPSKLSEEKVYPLLKSIPFVSNSFFTIMIKEIKEIVRNKENQFLFTIIIAMSLITILYTDPTTYSGLIIFLIFILSSTQSYNSFGRESNLFGVFAAMPFSLNTWIFAKLLGNIIHNLILAALLFFLFMIRVDFSILTFLENAYIGILVSIALFFIGIIIPYNPEHPYSTAFTAVLVSFVGFPTVFFVMKITDNVQAINYPMLGIVVSFILLFFIKWVFSWRRKHDYI